MASAKNLRIIVCLSDGMMKIFFVPFGKNPGYALSHKMEMSGAGTSCKSGVSNWGPSGPHGGHGTLRGATAMKLHFRGP